MTTYKIINVEVDSLNSYVRDIVLENEVEGMTVEVNDSYMTFEEREEKLNEVLCEKLGLSSIHYNVYCTYEVVESDCDHTWIDPEEN